MSAVKFESLILNEDRNVKLSCFLLDCCCTYIPAKERPAVIILPGGAYQFHSDRESEPVAQAFLDAGFHAFILYYSVGRHAVWPNPLTDYEQAADAICSHAEDWHVCTDKIAVIGFSAGGHLAACAATMAKRRPAAAILGYPVINDYIAEICTPGLPLPADHVDRRTSPCFLFGCRDDRLVDVSNFLAFESALARQGIQFESHLYAMGGHGFSTGAEEFQEQRLCSRVSRWTDDAVNWLGDIWGKMMPTGFSESAVPSHVNKDGTDFLSLDCTIAYLRGQSAARPLLDGLFSLADQLFVGRGLPERSVKAFEQAYTMRFLAAVSGMDAESMQALDAQLMLLAAE